MYFFHSPGRKVLSLRWTKRVLREEYMRRREFITPFSGAVTWPIMSPRSFGEAECVGVQKANLFNERHDGRSLWLALKTLFPTG